MPLPILLFFLSNRLRLSNLCFFIFFRFLRLVLSSCTAVSSPSSARTRCHSAQAPMRFITRVRESSRAASASDWGDASGGSSDIWGPSSCTSDNRDGAAGEGGSGAADQIELATGRSNRGRCCANRLCSKTSLSDRSSPCGGRLSICTLVCDIVCSSCRSSGADCTLAGDDEDSWLVGAEGVSRSSLASTCWVCAGDEDDGLELDAFAGTLGALVALR